MHRVTLVTLLILASCDSDSSDPAPTADAAAGGSVDSSPSSGGTADAAPQAGADAPTSSGGDLCAEPGAEGNEKGVGKYCTAGGNECSGNGDATFCTVDYEASAPPFCTMICFSPGDCGADATCESMGGLSGCTPACLTGG